MSLFPCDITNCEDPGMSYIYSPSGKRYWVCDRCKEELTAIAGYTSAPPAEVA